MSPSLCLAVLLGTLAPATQLGALQQEATSPVVELTVTATGGRAAGLTAEDLEIIESGAAAEVLGVQPAAFGSWQIVVYVDARLSDSTAVSRLANALSEALPQLAERGEIEIVVADPAPRTFLPPTDRLDLLEEAFARLALEDSTNALGEIRRAFLQSTEGEDGPTARLRTSLRQEVQHLRGQQDELIRWLGERGRSVTPRLFLLLNESFGLDPLEFYALHTASSAELATETQALPRPETLAQLLAAYGWTTLPAALEPPREGGRLQYRPTEELPFGLRLGLGRSERRRQAEEREREVASLGVLTTSAEQLRALAEVTGGRPWSSVEALDSLLRDLSHRYLVRYRSHAAANPRPLEVRSRSPGLRVSAPRFAATVSPESVAEARLRQAFRGELEDGDLTVASSLVFDPLLAGRQPGMLETRVDLSELGSGGSGKPGAMRVSVGVHLENDELVIRHEVVDDPELFSDRGWSYASSLMVPSGTDATLVLVEHLPDGQWGLGLADFVDLRRPADEPAERRRMVQILPPKRVDLRRGRLTLQVVTDELVRRVHYLLNGSPLTSKSRRPFPVKIDLDPSRPSHQLVAVAYDAEGRELDRDRLILNESAETFWVRIVQPAPGAHSGPVEVEATVKVPGGEELDRLELYLSEELVATLREPPFRRRLLIPVSRHGGFLRAAAYLRNGTVAEDVVLLSRPGFGEEIGVELVELYVVATDRRGKPVGELGPGAFTIYEEDLEQRIESFDFARDLPLTLGLAIDSSSSLFSRLPDVQRAAKGFVSGLIEERDRAFLVGFGTRPELIRRTTADLRSLEAGISSLRPRGTTPVWEAIVLSLSELQKHEGRRALVVFYDGDDEDEDFSYRTCLALARRARLPIYLIVMNNAAARSEGRSFSNRAFVGRLERLAEAGGGRVYFVPTEQDLREIFTAIGEELRSHYLMTYYAKGPGGGPQWRAVRVEVEGRGMTARTIPGYGDDDSWDR